MPCQMLDLELEGPQARCQGHKMLCDQYMLVSRRLGQQQVSTSTPAAYQQEQDPMQPQEFTTLAHMLLLVSSIQACGHLRSWRPVA